MFTPAVGAHSPHSPVRNLDDIATLRPLVIADAQAGSVRTHWHGWRLDYRTDEAGGLLVRVDVHEPQIDRRVRVEVGDVCGPAQAFRVQLAEQMKAAKLSSGDEARVNEVGEALVTDRYGTTLTLTRADELYPGVVAQIINASVDLGT